MLLTWDSVGPMFFPNFIKMLNWCHESLKMMKMSIVYSDVSYIIASWITLSCVLVMKSWVNEVWSPIRGNNIWIYVLPWTVLWEMIYFDSNDIVDNVLFLCWWKGPLISNPIHFNYLWGMNECYGMIVSRPGKNR